MSKAVILPERGREVFLRRRRVVGLVCFYLGVLKQPDLVLLAVAWQGEMSFLVVPQRRAPALSSHLRGTNKEDRETQTRLTNVAQEAARDRLQRQWAVGRRVIEPGRDLEWRLIVWVRGADHGFAQATSAVPNDRR
jgi:hypothetical protein